MAKKEKNKPIEDDPLKDFNHKERNKNPFLSVKIPEKNLLFQIFAQKLFSSSTKTYSDKAYYFSCLFTYLWLNLLPFYSWWGQL